MTSSSPAATLLAWLAGLGFVMLGIAGLLAGSSVVAFGLFLLDTPHNFVHILTGAAGIAAAFRGPLWSRWYLRVLGIVYAVFALTGLRYGHVFSVFGVTTGDTLFHVVVAVAALARSRQAFVKFPRTDRA